MIYGFYIALQHGLTLVEQVRHILFDFLLHRPNETGSSSGQFGKINIIKSNNTLAYLDPLYIPLQNLSSSPSLQPGESVELRVVIRSDVPGPQAFTSLLVYREVCFKRVVYSSDLLYTQKDQPTFFASHLRHLFDVVPFLELGASARPSTSPEMSYTVNLEVCISCQLFVPPIYPNTV